MEELKSELSQELIRILDFWQEETWDVAHGGFIGRIDGFGKKVSEAPKGIIVNARILWAFSAASNTLSNAKYAKSAHRAYEYILQNFVDNEFGGVYWEVDYLGKPVNLKKQVYAQAFVIYAMCEFYKAFHKTEAKNLAIELFHLLEKFSFDSEDNGYLEAYDRKWILLDDLRLSEKDANEKKTMNTHLHVLEAYTTLFQIWPDEFLKNQLKNLVRIHVDKILDRKSFHLNLFFDEKWNLKSSEYSFGHDIEATWLLCKATNVIGESVLMDEINEIAVKVTEVTRKEGLDVDGGLMQEGVHGRITDTDKHWWPQAEAIVGFINAWQLSHQEEFAIAAMDVWEFTKRSIIDGKGGEWWWRVNRAGVPYMEEEKAGFWKCPYHNGRACIEMIKRI